MGFFSTGSHIDGRASCQDDFETFYLQRKSQFEAFYQNVQKACLQDLKTGSTNREKSSHGKICLYDGKYGSRIF